MSLRKRSEIIRILVLAMTTADDGVSGSNFVWDVACFSLFYKLLLFGLLKAKQSILVSKIILKDPYATSRDLQGRKPY